jgi:hypothetical protein
MRELVTVLIGLVGLLGALLLGAWLMGGSGDGGVLGLLLLTGAGLFLQNRSLSAYARESNQLLSQRICRLEEQLKAMQDRPMAEAGAAADRPCG